MPSGVYKHKSPSEETKAKIRVSNIGKHGGLKLKSTMQRIVLPRKVKLGRKFTE